MDKFLCVFSEADKNKMLEYGYKLLKEDFIANTKRYIFINNNKLSFSHENIRVLKTSKLYF